MYSHRRRTRVLFVVLLLAAITTVTLDFRAHQQGPVGALRHVAMGAFGPLQRGVQAVVRPIGDLVVGIGQIGSLRRENRRLKAEVDRLHAQEHTYQDVVTQNDELRGALAMARRCGCKTVGATVVARSASNFQQSVTIDRGRRQGVAPDMAVLDADGLVGRVVDATADYATVLLVDDPSSGVAASLARTKAPGLLRGADNGELTFEPVQAGIQVRPGDAIVTQGYPGGVFPAGLPVGVVRGVRAGGAGLVPQAGVAPYAHLATLDVVAVVVAKPPVPPLPGKPGSPPPGS